MMNRVHNSGNRHQGKAKKVLCVCSAGLLRSPTTAEVLTSEYGYNTRAVGLDGEWALIPIDSVLAEHWADEIVVMTNEQEKMLRFKFPELDTPVQVLNIDDDYAFRDPELISLIKSNYKVSE